MPFQTVNSMGIMYVLIPNIHHGLRRTVQLIVACVLQDQARWSADQVVVVLVVYIPEPEVDKLHRDNHQDACTKAKFINKVNLGRMGAHSDVPVMTVLKEDTHVNNYV